MPMKAGLYVAPFLTAAHMCGASHLSCVLEEAISTHPYVLAFCSLVHNGSNL